MSYDALAVRQEEVGNIDHALSMLSWDEAVMMPSGGGAARAESVATMASIRHRIITADDTRALIEVARRSALDEWKEANLREIEREHDRARALPERLVADLTRASVACEQLWRAARERNDWAAVRAPLAGLVALCRQKADHLSQASGKSPYDALLETYQSGITQADIDPLFAGLRSHLPGLIERRLASQADPLPLPGPFPVAAQRKLCADLMERVGFDFHRGRFDVSHHPFCGGVADDTRITTRFEDDDLFAGLMGTLHETGHALYEQGLPQTYRRQPVGSAAGMAIHESQSLIVEMQVCRGRAFLEYAAPLIARAFGADPIDPAWSVDNLERVGTRVERGFIRVYADELTYPLHVVLRYEIERDLIAGAIEVDDVPAAWDAAMQALLGLSTQGNYRDGCMQDVHWFAGLFGYFPCYTVGAVVAAQLFAALKRELPNIDARIRRGDFIALRDWLRREIHSRGRLLDGMQLVTAATGQPLQVDGFLSHLEQRYAGSGGP